MNFLLQLEQGKLNYFKRILFLMSFFFILFNLNIKEVQAADYYVAKTGSDSNMGTEGAPFLTIQKGMSVALNGGDTVFVKEGTYPEYVRFMASGTEGNPITLRNFGSDAVTIDAENSRDYCISTEGKSNLLIDGIRIINSDGYNLPIFGGENITIKNLISSLPISNVFVTGIYCSIILGGDAGGAWAKNITLQNVTSSGGMYPLYVSARTDRVNIIGGHYSYGSVDGINIDAGWVALTPDDNANFSRNITIDGVETDHNLRQGIGAAELDSLTLKNFWTHHNGASGVQIERYCSNVIIEDFLAENNALIYTYETGVWVHNSRDIIVRRGIMRNNETGFRASNVQNVKASNLLIYANDTYPTPNVVNNDAGVSLRQFPPTYYQDRRIRLYNSSVELSNSVIYDNSNINSKRGTIDYGDDGNGSYTLRNNLVINDKSPNEIYILGLPASISSDKNIYFNTQRDFKAFYWPAYPAGSYTYNMNWSTYKATTGQETNSIIADPLFTNPSSHDFTLQANSPAIDAGDDVGLAADYLGNPIYGPPDIGAYEYQPTLTMGTNPIANPVRVYGDGKFRTTGGANSLTAQLSIIPQGNDTKKYLDVAVSVWHTSGDYRKQWTEDGPTLGTTPTDHQVGNLEPGKAYGIKVDNALATTTIAGPSCASGICLANSQGKITFTYTGGYSAHTFTIEDATFIAKAITAFSLASPTATGTLNEANHTVTISVPAGTNLTNLIPTITYLGSSIAPASGTPQNFTSPVTYTVTAGDATTQTYTVTVTFQAAPQKKSLAKRVITTSPKKAGFLTLITQSGKRFSKNSKVALHFRKLDGSYYPPMLVKTNGDGKFKTTYLIKLGKPKGTYSWYATDLKTGKKSKKSSYVVR
jgi:hypothetical protein